MIEFENDGLRLVSFDYGAEQAEAVILLHGFPGGPDSMGGLAEELSGMGHYVLVPAQRGYAPSASPQQVAAYRIDRLASDIAALAKKAGLTRYSVVGHDLGGTIAWQLASLASDGLASTVILTSPHTRALLKSLVRSTQALRSWYLPIVVFPFLPEVLVRLHQGMIPLRYLTAIGLDKETARRYVERLIEPGATRSRINWYRALSRDLPRLARRSSLTSPTLFIWGGRDAVVTSTAAKLSAQAVQGPFQEVELPNGSHWLPEQEAEHVAAMIQRHLGKN